ncbi:putative helicase MOV-10 [Sabethes cyaneus]|uniref:putative helicase MOV-10 n=1 Tax=Sabethes cyaneus TaxID=53552 RepID=UPI00237D5F79|nr:putative helicase MOV-10 [Sabethes cyaneus]
MDLLLEKSGQNKIVSENNLDNGLSLQKSDSMESMTSSLKSTSLGQPLRLDFAPFAVRFDYVMGLNRPRQHFSDKQRSCIMCRIHFKSAMDFFQHMNMHSAKAAINPAFQRATYLLAAAFLYDQRQLMSTLTLTNMCMIPLIVDVVYLYHDNFELFSISITKNTIGSFALLRFPVPNQLLVKSKSVYSLFIVYHRADDEQCEFVEHYQLEVFETKNKLTNHIRKLKFNVLADYPAPKEFCTVVENNFQSLSDYTEKEKEFCESIRYLCTTDPDQRLNAENYSRMLEIMVHVHDLNVQCDLSRYTAENAMIVATKKPRTYRIETKYFDGLPANLTEGDNVTITVQCSQRASVDFDGVVSQLMYDALEIELEEKIEAQSVAKVKFTSSRIVSRLELQALEFTRKHELSALFFPTKPPPASTKKQFCISSWFNQTIISNPEQQVAVQNIVNQTSHPLPYVLFGPPGTGKTTTLVEAVVQICTHHLGAHVLVTSQSNSVCDDITLRLLKFLSPNNLYRVYSRSAVKRIDELSETLKQCSNFSEGQHRWPTSDDLYNCRVVICTLSVCGRLVQFDVPRNLFKYVFIDECGSSSEPAALVAIAGLVSSRKKINACVVVAGDPYQLGPVIRSELADKMGLGISMLERLMKLPVYKPDPITKSYNGHLITKLLRNYRSHEILLEYPNKQFYGNELICVAPREEVALAMDWKWLPNKSFPIILHTVFGKNEQGERSKSRFNAKEIDLVEFYLDFILKAGVNGRKIGQQEIGVISPYQLQTQHLREMCSRRQWSSVEIGTVEQYQGREKLIIILSTVRSHTPGVGFLHNVKRLNVAMTRAKALLIVIGNSYTLQTDPNWHEFIKFCTENEATVGRCFELGPVKEAKRSKREDMFAALFNSLV